MFDGSNTSRILAADHIADLFRQMQSFFLNNLLIFESGKGGKAA